MTCHCGSAGLDGCRHDVERDDWAAPNSGEIQLEFGSGKGIIWFGRSCSTCSAPGHKAHGIVFLGSKGTIDNDGGGTCTAYDLAIIGSRQKLIRLICQFFGGPIRP